ncbi:hypothetical protein [Streptomyces sp. 4N124]|uniref:hypothetical protein n=1 Tax=Streptomyces sp. 4N124 TaxID=3457420 RepID=UPI003FD50A7C
MVSTDDGTAQVLDTRDGTPSWRWAIGRPVLWNDGAAGAPAPAVHDGAFCVGALTDRTVTAGHGIAFVAGRGCLCLDLRTGRTRWSLDPEDTGTELAGDILYGGATIDGRTIYLTLVGQDLMAVRSDRRKPLWNWERPGTIGSGPAPPPLLAGGYVFPQTAVNLTSPEEDVVAVDLRGPSSPSTAPPPSPNCSPTTGPCTSCAATASGCTRWPEPGRHRLNGDRGRARVVGSSRIG